MFKFFRRKKNTRVEREVVSPDGQIVARFYLRDGRPAYAVWREGVQVVGESRMGINSLEGIGGKRLSLVRAKEKSFDETWEVVVGQEEAVRNHYNEVAFYLEQVDDKRLVTLRLRVFDDGVAFRYEVPPQPELTKLTVTDEITEFAVDYNASAYTIPAYQPDRYEYNYSKQEIYAINQPVHTPMTVKLPRGGAMAIHEAALYDYGEMSLKFDGRKALRADIAPLSDGRKAYVELPWQTPWRVIMLGETELDLTNNRMIYNLNDAPRGDFSWVKPLKFMGIWWAMYVGEWTWAPGERHGATTGHAMEYIDSCARLGVRGLLIEGWNNGWDGDWLQNGAHSDFTHPQDDFDLDAVSAYAEQAGVELVGHHETVGFVDNYEEQIEAAYKYYADRGIHYIKPGYAGSMMTVQGRREWHHSQVGVRHYQKALELAARYKIMLDVHEPIKGTGIERTWPNLLTREGARGQEYEGGALSPSHACYLPFTRLLAGGMDYTSGIFDVTNQNKRMATTLARQLAYYVTIYSGMQMAADRPRFYEEVNPAAFKFIRDVPVNWSVSLPLLGAIGEYYVVARKDRNAEDWYVGGVTDEDGRRVRIALDFLDSGQTYTAEIYRDALDAHYRDNQLAIEIEERKVLGTDYLDISMAPGGGFAVRLRKNG